MVDRIFSDPLFASLYDVFDDDRSDLDPYVALVDEIEADRVLDVGCGTGSLLTRLVAERPGSTLVGVDPASASLDVARSKPGAESVRWIDGDATALADLDPPVTVDLAVMTGNVAQVFTTDEAWATTLRSIERTLPAGGVLAFETRDPERRAWERWTADQTTIVRAIPGHGRVEQTTDVFDVSLPMVSFETRARFLDVDHADLVSTSTLIFRTRDEIESTVRSAGLEVIEVRDAPDRPGLEWVFLCERRVRRVSHDPTSITQDGVCGSD